MSVTVQWLGHASFRISGADEVIYIDPWKISGKGKDATVVLISHSHYDHYSSDDVGKVSTADTEVFGSGDVIDKQGGGGSMKDRLAHTLVNYQQLGYCGAAAESAAAAFPASARPVEDGLLDIAQFRPQPVEFLRGVADGFAA